MTINIEIGIGEAFDRLSILKIKLIEIKDEAKLMNIQKEHDLLVSHIERLENKDELITLYDELYDVNYDLWDIENELRAMERNNIFDELFVETARNVYIKNDLRAKIKKKINLLYSSDIIEEKSYENY